MACAHLVPRCLYLYAGEEIFAFPFPEREERLDPITDERRQGDHEPSSQLIASGSAIRTVLSPTAASLCLRDLETRWSFGAGDVAGWEGGVRFPVSGVGECLEIRDGWRIWTPSLLSAEEVGDRTLLVFDGTAGRVVGPLDVSAPGALKVLVVESKVM